MYERKLNNVGIQELREDELMETNGGAVGCLVVGGIIVIGLAAIAVGMYLGYQEEKENRRANNVRKYI